MINLVRLGYMLFIVGALFSSGISSMMRSGWQDGSGEHSGSDLSPYALATCSLSRAAAYEMAESVASHTSSQESVVSSPTLNLPPMEIESVSREAARALAVNLGTEPFTTTLEKIRRFFKRPREVQEGVLGPHMLSVMIQSKKGPRSSGYIYDINPSPTKGEEGNAFEISVITSLHSMFEQAPNGLFYCAADGVELRHCSKPPTNENEEIFGNDVTLGKIIVQDILICPEGKREEKKLNQGVSADVCIVKGIIYSNPNRPPALFQELTKYLPQLCETDEEYKNLFKRYGKLPVKIYHHPAGIPQRMTFGDAFYKEDNLYGEHDIESLPGSSGSGLLYKAEGVSADILLGVHSGTIWREGEDYIYLAESLERLSKARQEKLCKIREEGETNSYTPLSLEYISKMTHSIMQLDQQKVLTIENVLGKIRKD